MDWNVWAFAYGLAYLLITAAAVYPGRWPATLKILDDATSCHGRVVPPRTTPVLIAIAGAIVGALGAVPLALSALSPNYAMGPDSYTEMGPVMTSGSTKAVIGAAVVVALIVTGLAAALQRLEIRAVRHRSTTKTSMLGAMGRVAFIRFVAYGGLGILWGIAVKTWYGEYSDGLEWFQGIAVGLFFGYVFGLVPSLWSRTRPSRQGIDARAFDAYVSDRTLRPVGPQYAFLDDRLIPLLAHPETD